LELLQSFVNDFLTPFAGNHHLGLFIVIWFSAIFPLAPPEEAFTLLGGTGIAANIFHPIGGTIAILAGILATDITQYWMGRGGLKLISGTRLGNRFINSRKFKRARQTMKEKGIWAIIGCRFFFGTRAPTYIATGFLRYRFLKFVTIESIVVVLHGILFIVIGFIFSEQIDSLIVTIEKMGIWSLVILVLLIAAIFGYKHLKARFIAQKTSLD
jgi:membrane protein DedA with SNARE-associated domain